MNKMKRLREENGYTQKRFAELLDVSIATVQSWEQENRNPGYRSKKDIKKLLKVDVDALFVND